MFGATIAAHEGASYWSEAGEAERAKINEWIRHGGGFDAVLDFDAGYEAVGGSIDLKLFR